MSNGNEFNLMIVGRTLNNTSYNIFDVNGKLVDSQKNITSNNNTLNISTNLASGKYILQLLDEANVTLANEEIIVVR